MQTMRKLGLPRFRVQRAKGFTLIELMVVIAIVAILAKIAAPSFSDMMRKNRLSAASSALQVSLNLARSEAVKRGSDALVTVAANTTAGDWANGWTVFVDSTGTANNAVAPTADSSTVTRIEIVSKLAGPVSTDSTLSTVKYFTYNGQGKVVTTTGAYGNRQFWFYDDTSDKYCLIVSSSGRVRMEKVATAASCSTS